MRCFFEEKKAQLGLAAGRFVLIKHRNPLKRLLAALILWLSQRRYGDRALDFLEHETTHDDHF